MKLFIQKPVAALLFACALMAATASATEANTERSLQGVQPTMAPTPHMMMPSHDMDEHDEHDDHDDHDDHEGHDHTDAPTASPVDAETEGDGAAAIGGSASLVAAAGCAVAVAAGALSML